MEHEWIAQIIDILWSTREMKIFFKIGKLFIFVELFFKEVFNSFYVVVSCFFDFFYSLTVFTWEISEDIVEKLSVLIKLRRILANDFFFEKKFEPFELYIYSVFLEGVFAEVWSENVNFWSISSVDWRNCCKIWNSWHVSLKLFEENFG